MSKQRIVDLTYQLAALAQVELHLEKLEPVEGVLTKRDIDDIYKKIRKASEATSDQRDKLI